MNVQRVVAQHIRDAPRRRVFEKNLPERKKQWKVEQRVQAGIYAVKSPLAAGEERSHGRVGMKNFADGRQIGIDMVEPGVPSRPKAPRDVGKRIQPKAVEAGTLHPPDAVLQKIFATAGFSVFRSGSTLKNQPSVRFRESCCGACGSASASNGSLAIVGFSVRP